MEDDYAKYRFTKEALDTKREDGISAFMRIKNGEDFLELTIESHIDFFDEIIACYNDCTDNTEKILQKLQKKYPQKIKIYHYEPKVYFVGSKEQKDFGNDVSKIDEIHSFANYSNFTLAKTTKKIAVKLDDDHLAVPENLSQAIKKVRKNGNKRYYFSGINLMRENDKIGVTQNNPFSGNGDIYFFPVSSKIYFTHNQEYEILYVEKPKPKKVYLGLLFLHLKYLKKCKGLSNYNITNPDSTYHQHIEKITNNLKFMQMAEFAEIKPAYFKKLYQYNPISRKNLALSLLDSPLLAKIVLCGRSIMLIERAFSFKKDIKPILANWKQTKNLFGDK